MVCSLDKNLLTSLPNELVECQNLTKLSLIRNLQMYSIPDFICQLLKLETLHLTDLILYNLPTDIGNLTRLKELRMRGCCMTSLPQSFKKLQNLEHLYLSGVAWIEVSGKSEISRETIDHFLETNALHQYFKDHPKVSILNW